MKKKRRQLIWSLLIENLIMKTIKMRLILDCQISKDKTSNTIAKVNLINS